MGYGEPDLIQWGLGFVVHVLNFDFDSVDEEDLLKRVGLDCWGFDLRDPGWRSKAQQLKIDLMDDLLPIINPKKRPSPTKAFRLMDQLVNKINSLGLVQDWTVVPVDHFKEDDYGMAEPKLVKKEELFDLEEEKDPEEIIKRLGRNERILDIFGLRWVVKPRVLITSQEAARQMLYWIIIRSLENGTIMQLGQCMKKECKRFFIAKRMGQKYCTSECTKATDTKAARERMRDRRILEKEEIREEGLPKLSRLANQIQQSRHKTIGDLIERIPQLKTLRGDLGEMWDDFMPAVQKICNGRDRSEAIWESLPPRLQKALAKQHRKYGPKVKVARRPRKAREG